MALTALRDRQVPMDYQVPTDYRDRQVLMEPTVLQDHKASLDQRAFQA